MTPLSGRTSTSLALSEANSDVVVERSFSNKPRSKGAFDDFYHKIESYVGIISGPAIEKFGETPYTFRIRPETGSEPPFKFHDTLTSRAEILDLSAKFKNDVIAIIGVGGTGAYVLDFLAKTSVREIRLLDGGAFHVHNAYRSPGSTNACEFRKPKVQVYSARYATFRDGIVPVPGVIDSSSADELQGVTFAFVCVDKGSSRAGVFDALIAKGIPFIDVGMGLNRKKGNLNGMLRVTYYSAEDATALREKGLAEFADHPNHEYRTNIQIGELNALNACVAVIKFKQLRGFYSQESPIIDLLFEIADLKIVGESEIDAF